MPGWKRWGINYLASSRFTFWKKHKHTLTRAHKTYRTVRNQFEIKTRWRRFEFLLLHIRNYYYCCVCCRVDTKVNSFLIAFESKPISFYLFCVDCSNFFFEYHCGRKNTNSFWLMCESISRPPMLTERLAPNNGIVYSPSHLFTKYTYHYFRSYVDLCCQEDGYMLFF